MEQEEEEKTPEQVVDNREVILIIPDDDLPEPFKMTVKRAAVMKSELIESILQDDTDDTPEIPVLNVDKETMQKVIAFLDHHLTDPMAVIEKPLKTNDIVAIVGKWDADFVDLEKDALFKLILAANYLAIPTLLDLTICKLACMVKGKEPEEVKKMFNIDQNVTPEEEKLVREQNGWIFEVPGTPSTSAAAANAH